ncbi:hypothetical protein HYW55_00925 [Candidatus Gottesmanbacteria bacterium]|nr:hypothetical protein [Candidatus Gottesmanbacteria bacterium]
MVSEELQLAIEAQKESGFHKPTPPTVETSQGPLQLPFQIEVSGGRVGIVPVVRTHDRTGRTVSYERGVYVVRDDKTEFYRRQIDGSVRLPEDLGLNTSPVQDPIALSSSGKEAKQIQLQQGQMYTVTLASSGSRALFRVNQNGNSASIPIQRWQVAENLKELEHELNAIILNGNGKSPTNGGSWTEIKPIWTGNAIEIGGEGEPFSYPVMRGYRPITTYQIGQFPDRMVTLIPLERELIVLPHTGGISLSV